jgi:hypothetical protein
MAATASAHRARALDGHRRAGRPAGSPGGCRRVPVRCGLVPAAPRCRPGRHRGLRAGSRLLRGPDRVSVGAAPLDRPGTPGRRERGLRQQRVRPAGLSARRWFLRSVLRMAAYRSYRDPSSLAPGACWSPETGRSADLAFSLPASGGRASAAKDRPLWVSTRCRGCSGSYWASTGAASALSGCPRRRDRAIVERGFDVALFATQTSDPGICARLPTVSASARPPRCRTSV